MTQRGHLICGELKRNGVEYIAWVPDSETHFMHGSMLNDPALRVIQVCAEGEAVAICAGMHLGGKRGVVLIENQGAFDSGNVLKWAVGLHFPLVLLIGYLGYRNLKSASAEKMTPGEGDITESFLEAMGIPYELLDSDQDVGKISAAFSRAERDSKPVALLLTSADDFVPGGKEGQDDAKV
jgi:phosphonopyruvate decarboxylase